MEFFEQEVKTETHSATFWEKLEVWTSLPISKAIQPYLESYPCDTCGEMVKDTHCNPITGAFHSDHDCPTETLP